MQAAPELQSKAKFERQKSFESKKFCVEFADQKLNLFKS